MARLVLTSLDSEVHILNHIVLVEDNLDYLGVLGAIEPLDAGLGNIGRKGGLVGDGFLLELETLASVDVDAVVELGLLFYGEDDGGVDLVDLLVDDMIEPSCICLYSLFCCGFSDQYIVEFLQPLSLGSVGYLRGTRDIRG